MKPSSLRLTIAGVLVFVACLAFYPLSQLKYAQLSELGLGLDTFLLMLVFALALHILTKQWFSWLFLAMMGTVIIRLAMIFCIALILRTEKSSEIMYHGIEIGLLSGVFAWWYMKAVWMCGDTNGNI